VRTFEIHSSGRALARREAHTAQQAVTDYLRSQGCADDEVAVVAPDSMAWRGSIFTAAPLSDASRSEADTRADGPNADDEALPDRR
jgi:hypothetical protein